MIGRAKVLANYLTQVGRTDIKVGIGKASSVNGTGFYVGPVSRLGIKPPSQSSSKAMFKNENKNTLL